MPGMKESHFRLLSDAEQFVDAAIDAACGAFWDAGLVKPSFVLNHAHHSNTFILTFIDPLLANWTVTYEVDDVQAAAS